MRTTRSVVVACVIGWFLGLEALAANHVYYSVGQNTDDHKTGSPTVTISGGVATFSEPQTAANMGVGDRVTYGSGQVAYIAAKQSPSVWVLVTATGGTPPDVADAPVVSIAHEYAALSDAIAGASDAAHLATTNLVEGDYVLNIPCYYDSRPDSNAVWIAGIATGPANYIRIYTPRNTATEVNQSQRHNGAWNAVRYTLSPPGTGYAITVSNLCNHVRIDGLQILAYKGITTVSAGPVAEIHISNNIIRPEFCA